MKSRLESLPAIKAVAPVDPVAAFEPLLTASEVATRLAVPRSWVYEKAGLGIIPSVKVGAYRRFRWSQVVAWVEEVNA